MTTINILHQDCTKKSFQSVPVKVCSLFGILQMSCVLWLTNFKHFNHHHRRRLHVIMWWGLWLWSQSQQGNELENYLVNHTHCCSLQMLTEAIEETDTNAHIRIRVRRNSFRILRNILPISVSRFNSHNSRAIYVYRHVVVSHITLMSIGNMYLWLCVWV